MRTSRVTSAWHVASFAMMMLGLLLVSGYSYASSSPGDSLNASGGFIFDVIIQNATYLDDGNIMFEGDINTSFDDGESVELVDAPVNVTLHTSDGMDVLDECSVDGTGEMVFTCVAENISEYTMISRTVFDNDDYYLFAEFDQDDIEEELIIKDDDPDSLDLDVRFEEAYSNARITGRMTSSSMRDDNELKVSVWPKSSDTDGYDERQTCSFTVPGEYDFECFVNFTEAGTYEINVTLHSGDLVESVREITYYAEPDYSLRLRHEGVYAVGNEVTVESYALLGNRPFTDKIDLTVESPSGVRYSNSGYDPRVIFYADEDGVYEIHAASTHHDEEYTRESKLVVATEDMFGTPPSQTILMDVRDFYSVNEKLEIPIDLEGVDLDDEVPATIVITSVDGETLEISSVFTEDDREIIYSPEHPGQYTVEVRIDDIDLSSTREIQVLSRMDYARDAVLQPAIEQGREVAGTKLIDIMNISYDEENSSYDLSLNISGSSIAHLRGVPSVDGVSGIQSLRSMNERISTDIFALDGLNVTEAEIILEKEEERETEVILRCSEWDYEGADCDLWELTDISFEQNETHVSFIVDSFSAYAGGDGFDSELLVWDDTSEDLENMTVLIDETAGFYANYSDFSTGNPIEPAQCDINFSDESGNHTMSYDTSETHEYERDFSERGEYDYSVMCTSDDHDDLAVSNSIDIYSLSYIQEISLTRSSLTLGYSTGVSCRVIDAFTGNGIHGYDVVFYSDLEGEIGVQSADTEGWASVDFEPELPGVHKITCMIEDDEGDHYIASNSEESMLLDVTTSDLFIDKDITHEAFGEFAVVINITNRGKATIYDVVIGDFVSDGFAADFNEEPDLDVSVSHIGLGTMHYWNIGSLEGNTSYQLTYGLSSITPLARIEDNTVVGGTYNIG